MKRKKQNKTKKKRASDPSISASEEALVSDLIREFRNADPAEIASRVTDLRIAQILIERLPADDEQSIPLMIALVKAFDNKHVRKAVKRALFKLEKRGIHVGELYPKETPSPNILKKAPKEKPVAYIGPVLNLLGTRAIMIVMQRDLKAQYMGAGIVSDEDGIPQFIYGTFSKKHIKGIKGSLSKDGLLIETSLSHAATILEAGYQSHIKLHSNAPAEYLELRPWLLENAFLLNRPVVYDCMSKESVIDKSITYSDIKQLFKHDLMQAWIIDFEDISPFMEEIIDIGDSPIFLSESQKADRARQIREKCAKELFPPDRRALIKHRLEEMAYIFFKQGHDEYSRLSLIAALNMDEKESSLKMDPVVGIIVERSFEFYMDRITEEVSEKPEEATTLHSAPRIILP
ncbi:MAG: hypothetical protein U9N82_03235 [Thermodesulfobacteriota bacterium]|nr:hypothetical protein [Thermodesulfobacteriota bacterium]